MKITKNQIISFKKLSKDKNKIHLEENFAKKFFFKKPIVHGIDLALRGIKNFLKLKKKKLIIDKLNIEFKNYTHAGEKFNIKVLKNEIIIFNDLNIKLIIKINYTEYRHFKKIKKKKINNYNFSNLYNPQIVEELIYISYYVGSVRPGNGSLIHKIDIKFIEGNNIKKKINCTHKTKSILSLNYQRNCFDVGILASKLVPFKAKKKKSLLSNKSLSVIKNKKLLIFGASSDLAKRFINCINPNESKIYKYKFRVNFEKPHIKLFEIKRLKFQLKKLKPDFILYFSSPNINNGRKSNKKLLKYYNAIYFDFFKTILKIINKDSINCKVLYPSTFFLNEKNKYRRLECYMLAKERAERLCESQSYKNIVSYYRFPQIKTRSNYNMLGFYEGEEISVVDKYFNNFFENI